MRFGREVLTDTHGFTKHMVGKVAGGGTTAAKNAAIATVSPEIPKPLREQSATAKSRHNQSTATK